MQKQNEADYIEPEDSLLMCRCLDNVGDIPADRGVADYPTINFYEDNVILAYARCKGVAEDLVSAIKIRVLPVEWFYDSDS